MSAQLPVSGERSVASVAHTQSRAVRLQRRLALGCVGLLGAGVLTWYGLHVASASHAQGAQRRSAVRDAVASEMKLPALPARRAADVQKSANDPGNGVADRAVRTADTPAAQQGAASTAPMRRGRASRAVVMSASPVMLQPTTATPVPATSPAATAAAQLEDLRRLALAPEHTEAVPRGAASLADALQPTVTVPAEAALVPTRRWLLPKGSFLDCTLETAIDSTLAGMTTCVLAIDAYGADGRVVLLERGTRLVGETRGEVRAGQARVSVLWSEARTPTGVVVALASPGTDALGRAGVPGAVDNHLTARFGAAMLLSVIDGAISGFVAHEQGSAGVIYNPQGTRDIATDALRNTIGIPPTINVPAGARIQVLVARDIDFRTVYRLAPRAGR